MLALLELGHVRRMRLQGAMGLLLRKATFLHSEAPLCLAGIWLAAKRLRDLSIDAQENQCSAQVEKSRASQQHRADKAVEGGAQGRRDAKVGAGPSKGGEGRAASYRCRKAQGAEEAKVSASGPAQAAGGVAVVAVAFGLQHSAWVVVAFRAFLFFARIDALL